MEQINTNEPSNEPVGQRPANSFMKGLLGATPLMVAVACGPQAPDETGSIVDSGVQASECMNTNRVADPAAYVSDAQVDVVNDVVALAQDETLIPLFNGSVPGIARVDAFSNPNCDAVELAGAAVVFDPGFRGDVNGQHLVSFTVDGADETRIGDLNLPSDKLFLDPDFEAVSGADFRAATGNVDLSEPVEAILNEKESVVVLTVLGSTLPGDTNPFLGINFFVSGDGTTWLDSGVQAIPYVGEGKSFNDPSLVATDEGLRVFWQTLPTGEVYSAPIDDMGNAVLTPGLNGSPSPLAAGEGLAVYAPGNGGLNFVTVESYTELGEQNPVSTHSFQVPDNYSPYVGDPSLEERNCVVKLQIVN